jgi:hypothetical protein
MTPKNSLRFNGCNTTNTELRNTTTRTMRDAAMLLLLRKPPKDAVRSAHSRRFGDRRQPETTVGFKKGCSPYRQKLGRRLKNINFCISYKRKLVHQLTLYRRIIDTTLHYTTQLYSTCFPYLFQFIFYHHPLFWRYTVRDTDIVAK